MSRRFSLTILTLIILTIAASVAIFLAKGYRFSPTTKQLFGTGILSITSLPNQASIYIDGHFTSASDTNIELEPKEYIVKISKEGFIPWEKKVKVSQGLVTEIKATLFPAIPSIYPLTFNGVHKLTLSPENERIAFIVPGNDKKSGVWVWDLTSDRPVAFGGGKEPHQVLGPIVGLDLTKADLRFSPDSNELLVSINDSHYLLDAASLNDNPRDIAPLLKPTLASWQQQERLSKQARLDTIKDLKIKNIASSSALVKFSPDQSKILFSEEGEDKFKVADLREDITFDLPEGKHFSWLADSRHLILAEEEDNKKEEYSDLSLGKLSLIGFDGVNKAVIYAGNFDPRVVFSWPDSSRLVMVSSLATPTANQPNLFGINLK